MDGISSWWEFVSDHPDEIWERTLQHVQLVGWAVAFATAIAVSTGIVVHRHPSLRAPWLSTSGVFLTIPSLALFSIFIPLVGLGFRPSVIALTMYSILPILRNTVAGLEGVERSVIESAKGVGLNGRQRLVRIELPLAWPVILTGIRVATVLSTGIAAIAVLVGYGGLGYYIQDGLNRTGLPTSVERTWTGTVSIVLLALVLDAALGVLRRVTTPAGIRP
jgi:osmoprotectant transport system permease protein